MVERNLFCTIWLVRNWGRIGTNGQELVQVFAGEIEADRALGECAGETAAGVSGSLIPFVWERIPDGLPEDFQALDGDEIVGRVYQIPTGPERGLWFWTMTALRPGPRITSPTRGTKARRGYTGRRVRGRSV